MTMNEVNLVQLASFWYPGRRVRKSKRLNRLERSQIAKSFEDIELSAFFIESVRVEEREETVDFCDARCRGNGLRLVAGCQNKLKSKTESVS